MTTNLYAGLLAIMFVALSVNVIKSRRKFGVGLGDAENQEIKRKIRAHGNFGEYSVFFIALLALAEHGGLSEFFINLFGTTFIAGRIPHAYSILKAEKYDADGKLTANPIYRVFGMICTFTSLLLLALVLIGQYFS